MISINAYLNFNGNTEEAFNFYKSVFGGEFTGLQRFKDTPHAGDIPAADQEKIMHISLPIGKSVLMGTDVLESLGQRFSPGNNVHLTLNAESEAEADRLFNGLSAGGKAGMPMQKMFWGAYFGMCADKYQVSWMISHDPAYQ